MRFSLLSIAALVGFAVAAPIAQSGHVERSLISWLGDTVATVEQDVHLSDIEHGLNDLLGETLGQVNDALHVNLAESLHNFIQQTADAQVITAVGDAILLLHLGKPLDGVNYFLSQATGGLYDTIDQALDIDGLGKSLGVAS